MANGSRPHRERILQLGAESNIVAIATEADPGPGERSGPGPDRPMVIFLNAGVLHRVGPHRLHVVLARRLARSGFPCLRLDLSGIGDSRGVPGDLTFRASAVADTRAAMDRIAADSGIVRFVLFGLCSGADNALATAEADPRVVGLILIDAPAYATRHAHWRDVRRRVSIRLRQPIPATRHYLRSLGARFRRLARRLGERQRPGDHPDSESAGRQSPPKAEYGELLTRLLDRGIRILGVYSGSLGRRYNHRDQLFEVFPALRGRLELAFFPLANHVFTELAQRNALIELVTRWSGESFT